MRPYFTHALEKDREEILEHHPSEYLAIVDLETYQAFAGREVDHLDMMAHLQVQMNALTAVAWGAPNKNLHVRLVLTEDHLAIKRLARFRHTAFASGWIRTNGQLCFTSHERLYDCAHHRTHGLLRDERLPRNSRPHVLDVPPGIYSIQIFYHIPFPYGGEITQSGRLSAEPKLHYTVILRRYAFPPPRVAPMRLSGGLIPWAGAEASARPWGGFTPHLAGGE